MVRKCDACDTIKDSCRIPLSSNVCGSCRRTYTTYKSILPSIEKLECVVCHETKILSSFVRLIKKNPFRLNKICRQCRGDKLVLGNSTLFRYNHILRDRMAHNIRNINLKLKSNHIPFTIKTIDIICQYYMQNQKCTISDVAMTHVVCDSQIMLETNPQNMVMQMIKPCLGYVPGNIELVCANLTTIEKSPGFVGNKLVIGQKLDLIKKRVPNNKVLSEKDLSEKDLSEKGLPDVIIVEDNVPTNMELLQDFLFNNYKLPVIFDETIDQYIGSLNKILDEQNPLSVMPTADNKYEVL